MFIDDMVLAEDASLLQNKSDENDIQVTLLSLNLKVNHE
jgi:hypothetical protein